MASRHTYLNRAGCYVSDSGVLGISISDLSTNDKVYLNFLPKRKTGNRLTAKSFSASIDVEVQDLNIWLVFIRKMNKLLPKKKGEIRQARIQSLIQFQNNKSLFVFKGEFFVLAAHVDDYIIATKDEDILEKYMTIKKIVKKLLKYFYNNRDIGLAIKRDNTSDLIIVAIINVLLKSEFDLKS
ncbi:hypothetical protein RI543_005160 [Arxiozyma heterogenica]|uniref:Uncharacterized protein n=1 Tax=Arxiozyma heterogenica TaxID=278026 RepID=A0AAN7WRK5_9SACH|nr:hypothetical protein RI543_005160 [Kazachstania heterogenica]